MGRRRGAPAKLILYTRSNCHLCDQAKALLARLQQHAPFEIEERDVDTDPAWLERYGSQVPVGVINDRKIFKYRVVRERLYKALESRTER
ncbi:MAG: glutaredoxin family protein [Acidobacteriota bacterium]